MYWLNLGICTKKYGIKFNFGLLILPTFIYNELYNVFMSRIEKKLIQPVHAPSDLR